MNQVVMLNHIKTVHHKNSAWQLSLQLLRQAQAQTNTNVILT